MTATLPPVEEAGVSHRIVSGREQICGVSAEEKPPATAARLDAEQAKRFLQAGHVVLETGQNLAEAILRLVGHGEL